MAITNVLVCKGVDLTPFLTSYEVTISDIDIDSTRTTDGSFKRTKIATKRKISVQFKPLTQTESQIVLNSVADVFFTAQFKDPQAGTLTKQMYVSERTTPFLGIEDGYWNGLAFELTEQ
jgi:hypothetical protein